MNSSAPWARIIIVNYNAGAMLQDCVNALAAQTMGDFEVVILDNASSDGSIEKLALPDARFKVVRSPENLGFAAGNNRAASDAEADWIATLNPDTRPRASWLSELRAATERYPYARVYGTTQIDATNTGLVDGFGDVYCMIGLAWRGLSGHPVEALPERDKEVFAPCAAAALYARAAFQKAGGFDESFFCYLEDVDLGFRLRLLGERCIQVRKAEVLHVGSAISGRNSDFTIYHSVRNRIWLLVKNTPGPYVGPALIVHLGFTALILLAIGRSTRFSSPAFKGIWAGLKGLPGAFRARRAVQRQRTVGSWNMMRMMEWNIRKSRQHLPHFLSDPSPADH